MALSPKRSQNVRNMFTAETDVEIETKQLLKLSYAAQLQQQIQEKEERKKRTKRNIQQQEEREHQKFLQQLEEETVLNMSPTKRAARQQVIERKELLSPARQRVSPVKPLSPTQHTPAVETPRSSYSRYQAAQMTISQQEAHETKLKNQQEVRRNLELQIEEKKLYSIPPQRISKSPTRRQELDSVGVLMKSQTPRQTSNPYQVAPTSMNSSSHPEHDQLKSNLQLNMQCVEQLRREVDELRRERQETLSYQKPNFKLASPHRRRRQMNQPLIDDTLSPLAREMTRHNIRGPVPSFTETDEMPMDELPLDQQQNTEGCLNSTSSFIFLEQQQSKHPRPTKASPPLNLLSSAMSPMKNTRLGRLERQSQDEIDEALMNFVNKTGTWA